MDLMNHLISNYNSSCAVVQNTGPVAITQFWVANQGCSSYPDVHVAWQMNTADPLVNSEVVVHHSKGTWLFDHAAEVAKFKSCFARVTKCGEWCSSRSSCSLPTF